jgi:1,4-dihydroxy-6-naphthoate synthase
MKLSLGFSPCPNDTFIFDALVNGKIDTAGLQFEVLLEDVQTLNQWALQGKLDITKLSYGVLPLVLDQYLLLNSGSALGRGVGPLLISPAKMVAPANPVSLDEVHNNAIAIPGENTTAHLLFSLAFPHAQNKLFLRYDEIEDFVLAGKGLGVIIHENRFTYEEKGLKKIIDLGDYWEKETGKPIPLGGIVISRAIEPAVQLKIDALVKQSIEYAFREYPALNNYIKIHAQEMSEAVMRKHIELYVNDFSLNLGQEGRAVVLQLLNVYSSTRGGTPLSSNDIFLAAN